MTDERHGIRVSHPILRLEVLDPNGERRAEHRVFCRYQRRSVAVGTCCSCVHCEAIVAQPAPAVACTISLDADEMRPDPKGLRTPVGEVLTEGAFAVTPQTTVRDALALLRAEDRRSVAVIDRDSIIVGVLHEATFAGRMRSAVVPREVEGIMSARLAMPEGTPVRRALELLARAHLREATVVDLRGVPLGVFRDIDGLRWLVRMRAPR